jgi:hypothetical protein
MNCQACDRPLTTYDEHRVACKNGHIWTLPEFADLPPTPGPTERWQPPKPSRWPRVILASPAKTRTVPLWLVGVLVTGVAVGAEVVLTILT